jgi:hypothetical protein
MTTGKHEGHGLQMHHVLGEGWVHTHGMDRHGLPELEVRGGGQGSWPGRPPPSSASAASTCSRPARP